jgi:hypothetical protein
MRQWTAHGNIRPEFDRPVRREAGFRSANPNSLCSEIEGPASSATDAEVVNFHLGVLEQNRESDATSSRLGRAKIREPLWETL